MQRAAYQRATLTMGLGFFTVKAVRHIALMVLCQRDGCGGRDRDPFVGWAKQQVELDTGIHQRFGIETP
ncbi:hypothetical protein D3C85_1826630 [compost metagenome]